NPAKHLQTRGTEGEPFYLVLARVTVTVPVTAIVIQESKGEFLIHISPPSLSLPQTFNSPYNRGGPGKILERRADRVLAAMFLIKYHKKQRIRGLVESSLALHIRLVDLFGFGWFRHQDIFMYVWSGDDFAIARRQIF
ncbi:hypothetical protein FOXYSP1_07298, partial [Fusarium oxysporum f. sp. phaseoli]